MFSSASSTHDPNTFLHFPTFSHHFPFPPFLLNQNPDEIFIQQNHQDPFFSATTALMPEQKYTLLNLAASSSGNNIITNRSSIPMLFAKKAVKRDRHTKINTAQGLRDRRVRLSIDISRKFFDLQDMLGFDKASKTLDWLLTKSRKAIKDLAKSKHSSPRVARSLSSASEYEAVLETDEDSDSDHQNVEGFRSKCGLELSDSKLEKKCNLVSKELRANARARARARTMEKMSNRNIHYSKKPLEVAKAEELISPQGRLENHQTRKLEGIFEGSSMNKRNLISKTDCFNSINSFYFPKLPQNWDINSAFARSGFCAITNMNLSTELQVSGKPWEVSDNQHLCS